MMKNLAEAAEHIASQQKEINELVGRVSALEEMVSELSNGKTRGPKTDRPMTEEDAFKVKFGSHKAMSHKEAAADLGLSYGQVFSCRGSYTFKQVKADWKPKAGGSAEVAK